MARPHEGERSEPVRGGHVGREAGQDPPPVETLPLVRAAVHLDEVARARIHRELRLRREVPVVPLDQLVHDREAPGPRGLLPALRELHRLGRLGREREPRLAKLRLLPVELVVDRAQPPHPDRRPLDRTHRRARVGPEVTQPLPQGLPLDRAAGEVFREDAALAPVTRRLRPDRTLTHDFPGFPGIHRG